MPQFASNVDLQKNQLLNAAIQSAGSDPTAGNSALGMIYYNTGSSQLKVCTNASTPTWVALSSGAGSVTSVSVVTANGLAGTVATATSTPAITLTTSVTGLLKGNGTAISAASAGTDYLTPSGNGSTLTGMTISQISGGAPLASPTFTGTVTIPATVNATDAAQKQYVDAAVQGLGSKTSARFATTGSETFTISSGNCTQISGTTLDGGSPSVGDVILIKDAPAATGAGSSMSSQPANGPYQIAGNTTNLTLTRLTSGNSSLGAVPSGAYVFIEAGTANASAGYVVSTPSTSAAFTYGSGAIQFVQFSGAGEITAGTGLTKSGNTLNISTVPVANGGTGVGTAQLAINALAGGVTNNTFLRGNGTNIVLSALTSADITTNAAITPNAPPSKTATAVVYSSGFTLGNASLTTITVTHNLNNASPNVTVWNSSGVVYCDVASSSANAITLTFATAPASNAIACTVVG